MNDMHFHSLRQAMVAEQLQGRDITSEVVLDAMRSVPRHLFVPENLQGCAYDDSPLGIGRGQTISQPYIAAYMTEKLELKAGMKVLEIGTGSGYQAAILAFLGCDVYSIELIEEHAANARKTLAACGFAGIRIKCGDGYKGWPEEAPFDAIIITAAPEAVPMRLIDQLKINGKMIVPVGAAGAVQSLKRIIKKETGIIEQDLIAVRFVPMVKQVIAGNNGY